MTRSMLAWIAFLPLAAAAADDGRISFLEQEVRNLQRQVQALSRQMDELRTRPDRLEAPAANPKQAASATALPGWVDAGKWRQLRTGMSEIEAIGTLGAPTSMREEDGARVLLYAMEIGPSGFLGGSVTLREHKVTEVSPPTLR
jgi:hypothetical protein